MLDVVKTELHLHMGLVDLTVSRKCPVHEIGI